MKIACYGSRFYGGQVDRIEQGFVSLGYEMVSDMSKADLIYANDQGAYGEVIAHAFSGELKGKIIFNVLDIPEHNIATFDLKKLDEELKNANAVTVISKFVQSQLQNHLKRDSFVIYNPIKPITFNPEEEGRIEARFASIGRRHDSNKRINLGVAALNSLGINYNRLALIGSEHIPWGVFLGVMSDHNLNRIYNNVDFVLALGKIEGLNLTVLEAMAAGVIPVVCNDMTTRNELLPPELFPEYNDVNPNYQDIAKFIDKFLKDPAAMKSMKDRLYVHFSRNWEKWVTGKGVALSILDVYNKINK